MTTLTRADLEAMPCQEPGCTHEVHPGEPIFLHQRCHPGDGLSVAYVRGTGALLVACVACGRPVCAVSIAPRPAPEPQETP